MNHFCLHATIVLVTILAFSSIVRQVIYNLEYATNHQEIQQNPRILVGDSHAAQLHLPNTTEISIEGSGLFLLKLILENESSFLSDNKTLIATVWHQNLMQTNRVEFNYKTHFWTDLMSLPFQWKNSQTQFGNSFIWGPIGSFALKKSQLNNSGTCFEGSFAPQKGHDPAFRTTINTEIADSTFIQSIRNCKANILFVVSPSISIDYKNKDSLTRSMNKFLALLPEQNNISILDLRETHFPDSCWRDWHHINCHGSQLATQAIEAKLSELNWN